MSDFDPDAVLATGMTKDEAEGRKALTPEGHYPKCRIIGVTAYEPHEMAAAKGVSARLKVDFECAEKGVQLSTYMNLKHPIHPKSTLSKCMRSIWPNADECASKTFGEMEGELVEVSVFHEDGDKGKWAEFRFTPA